MPWFQGNFHCHTNNSDGKATPVEVARYYKAIGMNFVAIADHNRLTRAEEYQSVLARDFIGIPCSEYTGAANCHVDGVDVSAAVGPQDAQLGLDPRAILQDGVDRIRAAGGVPVLCHPCWFWAYDGETVLQLTGVTHFEVFNALPACNGYPVGGASFAEAIWDGVLSAGTRIFGVASDDAHWYGDAPGRSQVPRHIPVGGTGWNVIKAARLERKCIRDAFESGHFYASTGIRLAEYVVTEGCISLKVAPWAQEKVHIEFVGEGGRSLGRTIGLEASYDIRGDEKYVRVRLADTSGCFALTQPVFPATIGPDTAWTREA